MTAGWAGFLKILWVCRIWITAERKISSFMSKFMICNRIYLFCMHIRLFVHNKYLNVDYFGILFKQAQEIVRKMKTLGACKFLQPISDIHVRWLDRVIPSAAMSQTLYRCNEHEQSGKFTLSFFFPKIHLEEKPHVDGLSTHCPLGTNCTKG